jgi:hypothetical protein
MDALAGDIAERSVDHPLAVYAALTSKGSAFNLNGEMRFARAIIA